MSEKTDLKRAYGMRLKQIRNSLSYTQGRMAAFLGISRDSYAKKENGEIYPGYGVMNKLAEDYNISMDWLLSGRGPMHFDDKKEAPEEEKVELEDAEDSITLSPEQRELFRTNF